MIDILGIIIIILSFLIIIFFLTTPNDDSNVIIILFLALVFSISIVMLNDKLSSREYIISEEKINIEDIDIEQFTKIKFSGKTNNIEIKKIVFDAKESAIFMDFDLYQIIIDSSILTIYPSVLSDSTKKFISKVLKEKK